MNILYVSGLCSDKTFKKIFENSKIKPQQQAQKFHSLLAKGLVSLDNNMLMVSRALVDNLDEDIKISGTVEIESNVTYRYLKFYKTPFIRFISLFIESFATSIRWCIKNRKEDVFVICDVLKMSISTAALLASKLTKTKSCVIVTDLPDYQRLYSIRKKTLFKKIISFLRRTIFNFIISRYSSYMILTEQMNKKVNPYNKPFVVIEGMVDTNMKETENSINDKYNDNVVIYAGEIKEMAGTDKLLEAFTRLDNPNCQLWIYGSGDMVQEVEGYCKEDHRIKYFGVVHNDIIVREQLRASLLVNPRPSNEEFTKYSFPSKNMEYMVSGTPLLTTPLPGMPKEYDEFVYLFEDETIDGIAKKLKDVLNKPKEELHEKGIRAKEFVLKEKSNIVQAKRLLEMMETMNS